MNISVRPPPGSTNPLSRRSDRGPRGFQLQHQPPRHLWRIGDPVPRAGSRSRSGFSRRGWGWAYRPDRLDGHPSRLFRAIRRMTPRAAISSLHRRYFPTNQSSLTEAAPNNYAAIGSFKRWASPSCPGSISRWAMSKPNAGLTTLYRGEFIRGKITSFNVSVQTALSAMGTITLQSALYRPTARTT